MPLPLPNLDTRRFDDLVAEMRARIPHYAPEWTNHNPSDPGAALVDILAWITESTLYRLNRIPESTYRKFIALLLGEPPQPGESLESARLRAVQFFNEPYRVVTRADFERETKRSSADVARVQVLSSAADGRITVVLVPASAMLEYEAKKPPLVEEGTATAVFAPVSTAGAAPEDALREAVRIRLNERKLVGTRILVAGPVYTNVELEMRVLQRPNTTQQEVQNAVATAVLSYLHPLTGGSEGDGWPFGRALTVFELYRFMEPIPGVDHVEKIVMKESGAIAATEIKLKDSGLPLLQSLTVEVASA